MRYTTFATVAVNTLADARRHAADANAVIQYGPEADCGYVNYSGIELPADENCDTYATFDNAGDTVATFDTLGDLVNAVANSDEYAGGVCAALFHTVPEATPSVVFTVYYRPGDTLDGFDA